MKKLLLASVAGVALIAGAPADAADLGTRPTYKAPPIVAPVPVFTWTGCYIGGHVGGGWGQKDFSDTALELQQIDPFFIGKTDPESIRADTSGFLGGGQVGCDYQFSPNWLIGIQGSVSGADIKGDVLDPFFPSSFGKTFHARTDWLADVSGRIGITWNRFMFYGKGGVAWAGDKYGGHELFLGTEPISYSASETRLGFVAGAGIEWAFWNNWSAFLEYDFYGFGRKDLVFACTIDATGASCGPFGPLSVKQDINVVRFGINWRWNWGKAPPPVVAKY